MTINNIADIIREEIGDEAFIAWEQQEVSVGIPSGITRSFYGRDQVELITTSKGRKVVEYSGVFIAMWNGDSCISRKADETLAAFLHRCSY